MNDNEYNSKANILIVDDRPDVRLAHEVVLETLGQRIFTVESGEAALEQLETREFAVVLLDVNMPGLDGFETFGRIRESSKGSDTPVIFITSYSDEDLLARSYTLGAVDFILAPVVPEVLRSKVRVFVDLFCKRAQVRHQATRLEQRAAQFQELTQVSLAIHSALSIEEILQRVTHTARRLIRAHHASAIVVTDDQWDKPLTCVSSSNAYAVRRNHTNAPSQWAIVAGLCRNHQCIRLTGSEFQAYQQRHQADLETDELSPSGWLGARLTGREGHFIGLIQLTHRYDDEFTVEDEAVLTPLAQMASIAIENTLYCDARNANQAKDEFLATLSHELRTPLNALLGWTRLLRDEELSREETQRALNVIESNANAQAKLIEDLLDLSRINQGKLHLDMKPVAIWPLVEAAVDAMRPQADKKRIQLQAKLGAGLSTDCNVYVWADADRLQQVLWNLLSNAVRFTPPQGRIDVTFTCSPEQVQVSIRDTGVGISPAFLPHVFDRFSQSRDGAEGSRAGLGIGLSIVRQIVELHQGVVKADSAGAGSGSTFTVSLPRLNDEASLRSGQADVTTPADAQADDLDADLRGKQVLIVDDDMEARELFRKVLSRAGASIVEVGSSEEAITAIDEAVPDIVLSDIAMPEEDGYALIRRIRQRPSDQGGSVPAIALTAYARDVDRQQAIQAGFQAHLAKPVDPGSLVSAVQNLFRSVRSKQQCEETQSL